MLKLTVFTFLLLLISLGSAFFLPGDSSSGGYEDLSSLKYPRKSFVDTIFTGSEQQPWGHQTDLSELKYPTDSLISSFISKAFGALAQVMVSHTKLSCYGVK